MTGFSHFDEQGRTQMVDIDDKSVTNRIARASGQIEMAPETLEKIQNVSFSKGNVLEVARLAGIMATKRTADLIPLCHPIALSGAKVDFEILNETTIGISAVVNLSAKTGAEMEALVAVSTAALTIYDMCKSVDRGMTISQIQVDEKSGGKSGHFVREDKPSSGKE